MTLTREEAAAKARHVLDTDVEPHPHTELEGDLVCGGFAFDGGDRAAIIGYDGGYQTSMTELAGETILATLTNAPGNDAPIGGLKVVTQHAWFAARPSGTEDVYKIYAESFRGPEHLTQVQAEAQRLVDAVIG